jgi:hypothetical protein
MAILQFRDRYYPLPVVVALLCPPSVTVGLTTGLPIFTVLAWKISITQSLSDFMTL